MTADGSAIVLSASGFLPGETLSVYFDNRDVCAELETHAADENGCLRQENTADNDSHLNADGFDIFVQNLLDYAQAQYEAGLWNPDPSLL